MTASNSHDSSFGWVIHTVYDFFTVSDPTTYGLYLFPRFQSYFPFKAYRPRTKALLIEIDTNTLKIMYRECRQQQRI